MLFYQIIKKFILDVLFPTECLGCKKEDVWLCDECVNKIPLKNDFIHNNSNHYLDGLIIATAYENEITQEAIHILKYKYVHDLAKPLGKLLASCFADVDKKYKLNIIQGHQKTFLLPVPLHKKRLLERGFNQSELIAKEFNKTYDFNIKTNILIRQKYTIPQVTLKGKARKENIKGAFTVKNWKFSGENVIILDDVATTLSTLEECAKVLKLAGAGKVWGLVVAHGG